MGFKRESQIKDNVVNSLPKIKPKVEEILHAIWKGTGDEERQRREVPVESYIFRRK